MFYSNGSNAETELALGASGTYLKSNGASSAPTWENPPLDIAGQTEDNADVTSADYIPWLKSGAVKRRIAKATNALMGLMRFATN